jgi:hypothetical protein
MLHVSTGVSKHPPTSSQLQNVPKLQQPSLGPPYDVVLLEVGLSEHDQPPPDSGLHEKGSHVHCELVALGQP